MLPGVRGVINPVVLDPQHPRAVGGGRRGDGEQGAEHGDRDARRAGGHGWVLRATARPIREASTVPATPARGGRAHRHTGSRPWGRAACHLAPAERTRGTPRGFSRSLRSNTPAQPSPAPLTLDDDMSLCKALCDVASREVLSAGNIRRQRLLQGPSAARGAVLAEL